MVTKNNCLLALGFFVLCALNAAEAKSEQFQSSPPLQSNLGQMEASGQTQMQPPIYQAGPYQQAPYVQPPVYQNPPPLPPIPARVSATEAPAIIPAGMLVSTTYHIEGFRIKEYKGIVRGVMVREPTIGQNFKASFQGMFGGHVGAFMQMCEQGRQQSYDAMIQNAQNMGANAVIGVNYDSNSFSVAPDQFATEVVCYGTAVVIEPVR